jgi:hypothetical protein
MAHPQAALCERVDVPTCVVRRATRARDIPIRTCVRTWRRPMLRDSFAGGRWSGRRGQTVGARANGDRCGPCKCWNMSQQTTNELLAVTESSRSLQGPCNPSTYNRNQVGRRVCYMNGKAYFKLLPYCLFSLNSLPSAALLSAEMQPKLVPRELRDSLRRKKGQTGRRHAARVDRRARLRVLCP